MMRLTLVRHGISEQTQAKIVDGAKDLPLSEKGIGEAKSVSLFVKEKQFDLVYSSTLQRAYNTAKILTKSGKNIIQDSRIVELRMGKWKDTKNKKLANKLAFDSFNNVLDNYINFANGAETFPEIKARVSSFIDELLEKYPNKTILVVSHGIALRAMLSVIFNEDMNEIMNMNNIAFTEIYFDKNRKPKLMCFNSPKPVFWG